MATINSWFNFIHVYVLKAISLSFAPGVRRELSQFVSSSEVWKRFFKLKKTTGMSYVVTITKLQLDGQGLANGLLYDYSIILGYLWQKASES